MFIIGFSSFQLYQPDMEQHNFPLLPLHNQDLLQDLPPPPQHLAKLNNSFLDSHHTISLIPMPLFGIRRISKAARGFPNSHLTFPGASSPMHTQTRKKILSSSRCVMCPATHYIFIVHIIIIMLKNGCNKEESF
jgi:hypothetical protein